MLDVSRVGFLEWEQLGSAVVNRQHRHRKRGSVRACEIGDDFRIRVAFDSMTTRVFSSDLSNIQPPHADLLDQRCAIPPRNFRNHDLLTAAFEFFNAGFATDFHATAAGLELPDPSRADDARWENPPLSHASSAHPVIGITDLRANAIDDFREIVAECLWPCRRLVPPLRAGWETSWENCRLRCAFRRNWGQNRRCPSSMSVMSARRDASCALSNASLPVIASQPKFPIDCRSRIAHGCAMRTSVGKSRFAVGW